MRILLSLLSVSLLYAESSTSHETQNFAKQSWNFQKWNGTFDRSALQRGFQVYKEVCSTCHGLKRIRFRELADIGFNEEEIKALAASYQIHDGPNDEGEMFDRSGMPSDAFPWVYKNANQAKAANNGSLPPDLSLMIKARKGGADYVYALLTGYENPPQGVTMESTQHWNKFFPGHLISMSPPLITEGQVTYADGTKATIDQMARDVVTFLSWAAEPEMEERKRSGLNALLYLFLLTGLLYIVKRRTWQDIKGKE